MTAISDRPMPSDPESLALAATVLEAAPDYRVLRRFRPRPEYGLLIEPKVGLYVDVETTGLNTDEDRIIQFAAVRFEFDSAGHIGQVGSVLSLYEDPGMEIPVEVVEMTGITQAKVAGQKIDDARVATIMQDVVLVIAHNADFDRKMLERRFNLFNLVAWACSQRDVKWERFGCRGAKLDYLVMQLCHEFYDAHDALADCLAGVHVLATPQMPVEQLDIERGAAVTPFQLLLDAVREPTVRLWAWQSPFETKDRLRLRRFRWNPDARCWTKDLKAGELEAEMEWLIDNVYGSDEDFARRAAKTTKVSAFDRYSVRA